MGKHKKKKKPTKKQQQNNKKNGHARQNPNSQKDSILDSLTSIQDKASSELSRNGHHNHRHDWKNNKGGKGKGKYNSKQYNKRPKSKSNMARFLEQLRPLSLGIRNPASDGNCFFRAIADQLRGRESQHKSIREEIVTYMKLHSDDFAPFYVGDFNAYLRKMAKNGVWGGNMELTAASKRYEVDIVVHNLDAARMEILYQLGRPKRTIHLSYHNERHYASVRRLDDMQSEAPARTIQLDTHRAEEMAREQQRAEIAWCHHGGDPTQVQRAAQIAQISDLEALKRAAIASKVSAMESQRVEEKEQKEPPPKRKKKRRRGKKQTTETQSEDKASMTKKKSEEKHEKEEEKAATTETTKGQQTRDPLSVEVMVIEEERKEDVPMAPAVCREAVTFTCVEKECGFSSAVLWLYLRHYSEKHLREENLNQESATQVCMCGRNNAADALFCVECGWDLRYKPIIAEETTKTESRNGKTESKTDCSSQCVPVKQYQQQLSRVTADALLHTNGKAIVIHKAPPKKRAADELSAYWSCTECSFYNHKSSSRCLVCAMVNSAPTPVTVAVSAPVSTRDTSSSWAAAASAYSKPNSNSKQSAQKPVKVSVRKKNKFGWLCSACTFENKPTAQLCAMCSTAKPKKTKKKKKNTQPSESSSANAYHADPHYAFEDEDLAAELASYEQAQPWQKYEKHKGNSNHHSNNEPTNDGNGKWSTAGNKKCPCGSGKKYKKCCKKRERRGYGNGNSNSNGYSNGHNRGGDGPSEFAIAEMEAVIERAEREIAQFRGKKGDKMQMHRELEKAKRQHSAMCKMAMQKQRDQEQQRRTQRNGNGVAATSAPSQAAARVIAI